MKKIKKIEGGLRLRGKIKKKPLITIITVVRNGEKTLERTIKSVINQTYKNFEYVLIDGNSTDKTLDIIKKYNSKIDYWISEPDKGIYDAMNKGVKLARGEYIYFLGCDDYLYNRDILRDISKHLIEENADLFYGDVEVPSFNKKEIFPGHKLKKFDFKIGRTIPHQGLFTKKKILVENGLFNLRYKICADRDQIYKSILKNQRLIYLQKTIAIYSPGGISTNGSIKETSILVKFYFGIIFYLVYLLKTFLWITYTKLRISLNKI